MGDVHPATEKLAIRSHLALLCRSLHCADSLVLYLNSPAASDGTMLLWDANHNGIVSGEQGREGRKTKRERGGHLLEAGAVMGLSWDTYEEITLPAYCSLPAVPDTIRKYIQYIYHNMYHLGI